MRLCSIAVLLFAYGSLTEVSSSHSDIEETASIDSAMLRRRFTAELLVIDEAEQSNDGLTSESVSSIDSSHDNAEEFALRNFKKVHGLKGDANLEVQTISRENTFVANGKKYSLDRLKPMELYAEGATCTLDSSATEKLSSTAASNIFIRRDENDFVMVTMDMKGNAQTIDVYNSNGSYIYMAAISPGVLATIKPQHFGPVLLSKYNNAALAHDTILVPVPEKRAVNNQPKQPQNIKSSQSDGGRPSEKKCTSYNVIDLAVVYDSTFCAQEGGEQKARDSVESIIAKVSVVYQTACTKVKISHIEGYCDTSLDPYREGIDLGSIGCNDDLPRGLLDVFREYWKTNRSHVQRDTAHLFYAQDFPGTTIGCAYVDVLCDQDYGYGANDMSYTTDLNFRAFLVAHELAHNTGLGHLPQSSESFIMNPSLGPGEKVWTSKSIQYLSSQIQNNECIDEENNYNRRLALKGN
jgi:hypothetical protein